MSDPAAAPRSSANGLLFFGAYDPSYPRNAIIRRGWEKCGFPVAECRVDTRLKVHARYPALLWRYGKMRDASPVIFVPDFRHKDVPLAWAIARCSGRRVVFDPLVSRFETRVLDREDVPPGSAQSRHNRNIDALSMRLADLVLADTEAHARFYAGEFSVSSGKIGVLPVGFDEDVFGEAPLPPERGEIEVLFYGTYLPLHGVVTIVEAASLLGDVPVRFTLVGGGQTFAEAKRRAAERPGAPIVFKAGVSEREIPGEIARADIVLGIFGTSPKSHMVVPNKLYQALAVGRPVVTGDTAALREFFEGGMHLVAVPPGNAAALADAVRTLAANRPARERLAAAGGAYVRREFNSRRIAERLHAILRTEKLL